MRGRGCLQHTTADLGARSPADAQRLGDLASDASMQRPSLAVGSDGSVFIAYMNGPKVGMKRWTDAGSIWESLGDLPDIAFAQNIKLGVDKYGRPWVFLANAYLVSDTCPDNKQANGVVQYFEDCAWQAKPHLACSYDNEWGMSVAMDPASGAPYMAFGQDDVFGGDTPRAYTAPGVPR